MARVPPAAAAAPPMPESFTVLWKQYFFIFSPPTAGRSACPAREVAASNKTAPPPMIPKLLTVTNDKNFTKKLNKENSPPGQSFLQVEKGGSFTKQSSILGSSCL